MVFDFSSFISIRSDEMDDRGVLIQMKRSLVFDRVEELIDVYLTKRLEIGGET